MNTPAIILVRPQMGENIGAVARAMSNFGLSDLRLVAPRDGWPNEKARDMAAGAHHIIDNAQIFSDFPAAMHDIEIAFATSARLRDLEKRVVEPTEAMQEIHAMVADGRHCALVFGPERTGLENDEIVLADTLITIPTDAAVNASLNLGQSMVVLGYEWFRRLEARPHFNVPEQSAALASKEELHGMFSQLEDYLDGINYFRVDAKKPVMWRNLQNIFVRSRLNTQEVRSLRGLFRDLYLRRKTTAEE